MNTITILEYKVRHYWRLSQAWRGQSEEFYAVTVMLESLRTIKSASQNSPILQLLCTKMIDEVTFQLNATEEELEALK